jgi:hypothetical protein
MFSACQTQSGPPRAALAGGETISVCAILSTCLCRTGRKGAATSALAGLLQAYWIIRSFFAGRKSPV